MKRKLLYLLILPLAFAACKTECKQESGTISHRQIQLKPFDQIKVEGPLKVVLRQDSTFQVSTKADSNAIELVNIKLSGQKLLISMKDGQYCGTDTVTVTAGLGDLKKMEVNGGARIESARKIAVNNLELNAKGANMISLDLNAGKLSTNIDGATEMQLTGQAGTHELKSTGNVNLDAFDFITGIYNLNLDGMAKLKINVLNELKIKTSGSSEVYYKGNPAKVDEKKSGTSKLEKVN